MDFVIAYLRSVTSCVVFRCISSRASVRFDTSLVTYLISFSFSLIYWYTSAYFWVLVAVTCVSMLSSNRNDDGI